MLLCLTITLGGCTAITHRLQPNPPPATCVPANVTISAGRVGIGLGHSGFPIIFRASQGVSCTLRGYPRVRLLPQDGGSPVAPYTTPAGYLGGIAQGSEPPTVTLGNGQVASSMIEGTGVPVMGHPCSYRYRGLVVGLPGATPTVRLTMRMGSCTPIEVHPVVPGATGLHG